MFTKRYSYKNNSKESDNSDDDNEESCKGITEYNNTIYFYTDVTTESIMYLCKILQKLESKLLKMRDDYKLTEIPNIYLQIQSYGGDAYAGISGMNVLSNLKVHVITIVDGYVASAATFLLLGGKTRWMRQYSNILIHQVRTDYWGGKFDEMEDEVKNCEMLMSSLKNIYKEKSTLPKKMIDSILKKELNLTCDQCINYKLVDKIL